MIQRRSEKPDRRCGEKYPLKYFLAKHCYDKLKKSQNDLGKLGKVVATRLLTNYIKQNLSLKETKYATLQIKNSQKSILLIASFACSFGF